MKCSIFNITEVVPKYLMVTGSNALLDGGDLQNSLGLYQLIYRNMTNGRNVWKKVNDTNERYLLRATDGGWAITDGVDTFIRSKYSNLLPTFAAPGEWQYWDGSSYLFEETILVLRDFETGKYCHFLRIYSS